MAGLCGSPFPLPGITRPMVEQCFGAECLGDFNSIIGRIRIDDEDFIGDILNAADTAGYLGSFVKRDDDNGKSLHVEGNLHPANVDEGGRNI